MDLKPKDTYRSECSFSLSDSMIRSLVILYQPLIGPEALLLYLTLHAESQRHIQETHVRLLTLMNMSTDIMERAFSRLEEYMLVRVFIKEGESRNSYIYLLNAPLNPSDFASSAVYMNRYGKAVGVRQAESSLSMLNAGSVSTQGYRDITKAVRLTAEERETDYTVEYTRLKPRNNFLPDDATISFDYERFIASTSTLVFPAELRTRENLYLIGKLATVYGLSADRMRILVKECVNVASMEFDGERLRARAEREQPDVKKTGDIYSLSPVSFLQSKQNGTMVSTADKRILEHLALDMHFSNEVINVMIEYILSVSSNRLHANFVDMVAGEWARDG
ncbi:MAG TPA: hypothetical protein DHW39_02855, partial [Erysipelotrichaceae bacterium]|nr:hypothetical protein [Erysipelotrichaceae bacterium]